MQASHDKLHEELQQTLSQRPPVVQEDGAPALTSPMVPRSSCGSNVHPTVEDPNMRYPVDEITEPRACKLYVMERLIKTKVAIGRALPTKER